jgi:hypothetical protein
MAKDTEITEKNGYESGKDPVTGRFVEGNPGGGRPKGTRDFATDFDEVVKDIAKENNMTVSDVRKVLLKQAYKQAKDGNYSFYKDIHDRVYGQAKSTNDVNVNGSLTIQFANDFNKNVNTTPKTIGSNQE